MPTLIEEIDDFREKHELSESQFGTLATNDKNLVPDLRAGRDVRMSTVERIRTFMADYRAAA
jgi:hypothetical protein